MSDPRLLLVDVNEIIREFAQRSNLYELFRYFPLKDLIETLLFLPPYLDDKEFIWEAVGRRLENCPDVLNYQNIEFIIEFLQEHLDQYVRHKAGYEIDTGHYGFKAWLGNDTMILENRRAEYETNSYPWFHESKPGNFSGL